MPQLRLAGNVDIPPVRTPHHVPRHLTLLGFVAGAAAAGAAYWARGSHSLSFLVFVVAWYLVTTGVRDVLTQPHPRLRAAYIALVPLGAAVATLAAWLALHDVLPASLIGLAAGPAVQWAVAQLFLRRVLLDKELDRKAKLGLL